MEKLPTLKYFDTKDRLRTWYIEVEDNNFRVVSGLEDGKKVTSTWKKTKAKNAGKKNATTAEEQAMAEADALYVKQKKKGWAENVEDISTPFIKPMLADKMKNLKKGLPFGQKKIWVQPKLDGFRCIISKHGMFSRSGERFLNCDHIFDQVKHLLGDRSLVTALDGELYNHDLHDNFNKLSSLIRKEKVTPEELIEIREKVQFFCYDVIHTMPHFLFEYRTQWIKDHVPKNNIIKHVATTLVDSIESIDEIKKESIDLGFEGLIIRINGPYEHKRTKNLIKYKRLEDAEYEVISIKEGKGNWSGMAKSVEIRLPNGNTCFSGMRGDEEFARQILKESDYWIGKLVTVESDGYTPDGALRFPVVTKWHDGKLEKRSAK